MGGYGSGPRWGGRALVEGSLVLDLYRVLRTPAGHVAANRRWSGKMSWRVGHGTARLGYIADLGTTGGSLRLLYESNTRGPMDYSVELETTEQPFGGRRWWFVCPRTGDWVAKLYLPSGATTFASRKAYRLAYQCQRDTTHDRHINQAWKARLALGGIPGEHPLGTPFDRPKYRHNRTFERDMEELRAKETPTTVDLLLQLAKWRNPWAMEQLAKLTANKLR